MLQLALTLPFLCYKFPYLSFPHAYLLKSLWLICFGIHIFISKLSEPILTIPFWIWTCYSCFFVPQLWSCKEFCRLHQFLKKLKCEVILYSGFDLHFLDCQWCWKYFYVTTGHLISWAKCLFILFGWFLKLKFSFYIEL